MSANASAVVLIVHGTPVRSLELELLARAAFPATTPILSFSTPAEAYQAIERHDLAAVILEETADLIAFAAHAADNRPGLAVGWVRNGAKGPAPAPGVRLSEPVTQADLDALAHALNEKRGS